MKNIRNSARQYYLCKLKTHIQTALHLKVVYLFKDTSKTPEINVNQQGAESAGLPWASFSISLHSLSSMVTSDGQTPYRVCFQNCVALALKLWHATDSQEGF